ncbi:hypothetical protein ACVWWO_003457 [Bradyrhizobium sp. F1.13.1]
MPCVVAGWSVEAREALLGHSGSTSAVNRDYGANEMLERWSVKMLRDARSKIEYVGLDLSQGENWL